METYLHTCKIHVKRHLENVRDIFSDCLMAVNDYSLAIYEIMMNVFRDN